MKKIELYLYLFLTAAVWVAIILGPLWADTPSIAAKAIALPFLAWIVLSVYYLVRWSAKRMGWTHKEAMHRPERQPAKA